MEEKNFKQIITLIIFISLAVLTFFMLKPILLSIIVGLILAFMFNPVYDWFFKKTKSPNLSASLVCVILVLLIAIPFWVLTPIFIEQALKFYVASQQVDFITPLKNLFPSLLSSEAFSGEIGIIVESFITQASNALVNNLSKLVLNFPTLLLQFFVVAFTFFFVLRDKEKLIAYIQSLLPFSKEVEKKLFESSKGITVSVIYGQIVTGIVQGIIAGIGFFLFGVPNALLLTLFATVAGILPIIGTALVWIPVAIYLLIAGNSFSAFGVIVFGTISSTVDNFLRPLIISKRTHMHSSVILISMVGGLFLFGVLGLILGPLIIAYLLIVLELYRNKSIPAIFIHPPESS